MTQKLQQWLNIDRWATRPNLILLLRVASALLFLGRAYQHFRWDAPYRTLFWNQALLEPFVRSVLDMPWSEYAGSPAVDAFIVGFQYTVGAVLFLCAIASVIVTSPRKWLVRLLYLGAFLLFFQSCNLFLSKYFQIGQLIEHASQWFTPVILVFLLQERSARLVDLVLKIAIALTFVGHGLYAVGFHPVPGHFIDMIISSLGTSEEAAREILLIAGILDMVIAVFIFQKAMARYVLVWAITWGFLTSIARIYAHVQVGNLASGLDAWLFQAILRAPHFILPLILWLREVKEDA